MSEHRYDEDDRVADVDTGRLGTVLSASAMINAVGYRRIYTVEWDSPDPGYDYALSVVTGGSLRPAEES